LTGYEDKVDEEIDRWVAAQLEQAPELRSEAMETLVVFLRESTTTEVARSQLS
jgi:hypothetical protein